MGKLQSKHACKRRENPEGDSFVVNAYITRRGLEECDKYNGPENRIRDRQELLNGELKDRHFLDDHCPLEVVLPPEKAEGCAGYMPFIHQEDGEKAIIKDPNKGSGKKRIHLDELECDVSVEDDNRQEWTFTLYDFDNSGKVTKEVIC